MTKSPPKYKEITWNAYPQFRVTFLSKEQWEGCDKERDTTAFYCICNILFLKLGGGYMNVYYTFLKEYFLGVKNSLVKINWLSSNERIKSHGRQTCWKRIHMSYNGTWATMAVCPGQQGPPAPLQVRQMGQESQLQVQPWTPAEVPPSQSCALAWIPGRGRVKKMGLEQMGSTRPLDRQRSCHGVGRSDGLIHLMKSHLWKSNKNMVM